MTDQEWRDVRYLYDYNKEELTDLANKVKILEQKAKKVYVVFNNNSGGHAAQNAKDVSRHTKYRIHRLSPTTIKIILRGEI